jgi:hypothetical protein
VRSLTVEHISRGPDDGDGDGLDGSTEPQAESSQATDWKTRGGIIGPYGEKVTFKDRLEDGSGAIAGG